YPSFLRWAPRGCCGIRGIPGKFQESEACLGDRRSSRTGCGGSEAVVGREVLRTLLGARRAPAGFSTEKIEHESAAAGRNWDSPVPLNRTNCANMRTILEFSAENAKIEGLLGGEGRIRNPETLQDSRGGIQPQFGALFGSNKSTRAGENLFAFDSALSSDLSGSPALVARSGSR